MCCGASNYLRTGRMYGRPCHRNTDETVVPFIKTFATRYITFLILKTQVHGVFGWISRNRDFFKAMVQKTYVAVCIYRLVSIE